MEGPGTVLTLTENAATIIKRLASASQESKEAGLRIYTLSAPDNQYTIEIAPAPEPGDRVVEVDGARVFLDTLAAPRLSGKELDALINEENVRFSLSNRK